MFSALSSLPVLAVNSFFHSFKGIKICGFLPLIIIVSPFRPYILTPYRIPFSKTVKSENKKETAVPVASGKTDETAGNNKEEKKDGKEELSRMELPVHASPIEETPGIDRGSFSGFADRRILLVEDNPVNRKLFLTLLADSGISMDSAEDGIDALQKLRSADKTYDLVLMDVHMPKMDGLGLLGEWQFVVEI